MLENRVLFHIGTDPWTLAAFCLALTPVLLVIAGVLFALLVRRHGHTRRLEGREASSVAFNAGKLGEARTIHGPAIGVEARVTFTIGDLRRAHETGDHLLFWGGPAMGMAWIAGFGLLLFAGVIWTRESVFLVGYLVVVPMFLIMAFMPWAAVYTKLE